MLTPGPPTQLKWYYRPVGILLLLFVVLGPLGLPYLWKSPGFSRRWKLVLTVLTLAYTALFLEEAGRVFREVKSEMSALRTAADL